MAWSLTACTVLCLLVPRPGYADPGTGDVPDSGAPPVASTPIQVPGTSPGSTATAPVAGPLGNQIMVEEAAVEGMSEQLTGLKQQVQAAHQVTTSTYQAWQQAQSTAADLRDKAENAAAEAYKQAQALGPFGDFANTMHQLGVLAPGFADGQPGGVAGSQTAAQDAARAEDLAKNAYTAYQSAQSSEQNLTEQQTALQATFNQRSAALIDLMNRNGAALDQAEATQEAEDARLAAQYAIGSNVDGMTSNPKALKAIAYALTQVQLGKPYVFGAEGPNAFDCSGLTWASYRSAGITIPRVARDQQHGLQAVAVDKMLPGDLLFYSRTSSTDWTTISHVAMYIGDNRMVEAANVRDGLKIVPVELGQSWFFSAARVVPAVPAPGGTSTSPTPTPTPNPTPTHSPTPSPTPSKTPSPTPTTPSPTPTTGSPSPSATPSTSSSPPATTESSSASPSAAGSASPSV